MFFTKNAVFLDVAQCGFNTNPVGSTHVSEEHVASIFRVEEILDVDYRLFIGFTNVYYHRMQLLSLSLF
jgi:hypothetical protein